MRVRLRSLLLAEKFSAALRLATILSRGTAKGGGADGVSQFTFSTEAGDTIVFPLRGHIVAVDYPESVRDWAATALDRLVDTEPVEVEAPLALHEALRCIAPGIDEVVVATDFDREGELIGVEALRAIRAVRPDVPARRARFSAMTPSGTSAIRRSLPGPREGRSGTRAGRRPRRLGRASVRTPSSCASRPTRSERALPR